MQENIEITGAREHNLQNVSVSFPRYTMTVVTGVSGSGKSSLVHDTLFKEGQRRFIESLSPYARQFLGQMQKPKVDQIEGLSPTICIDQKRRGRSARSTVGTITEIYDHLRLLFARLGEPHCPSCAKKIVTQTPDQISRHLLKHFDQKKIYILAPMFIDRKGEYRKELQKWKTDGFIRIRIDGKIYRLDEEIKLKRYEKHTLELVIDRIKVSERERGRVHEGIEQAINITGGIMAVYSEDDVHQVHSVHLSCPSCGISIPEMEPRLFSFNNAQGACSQCGGKGIQETFEESLIIPDENVTITDGALKCVKQDGQILFSSYGIDEIKKLAKIRKVSLKKTWKKLPDSFKEEVLWGVHIKKKLHFPGVIPIMKKVYDKWNLYQLRRFIRATTCKECAGSRLRREALSILFRDKNIFDLVTMTVSDLQQFLREIKLRQTETLVGKEIFKELKLRLAFLHQVGLGYLTLQRTANTLSGGEMQRIRLARQLGSGLQGVLYILDEPSIGLHPRDNVQLLQALKQLRNAGNSLVVIEHDEETMNYSDHIIDIGPGAGSGGGQLVAQGRVRDIKANKDSITGQFLTKAQSIPVPKKRRATTKKWLKIVNASEHNLKNIDVEIPLEVLCIVTGVSGSGKSTLIDDILKKALAYHIHGSSKTPGKHKRINGIKHIDKVIEVDQSPIGRTPRSNPATYTKVFDEIRNLFSMLPESKMRGYQSGRFSFNVAGGRCEECKGAGVKEIEMQFLSNVFIECEFCEGHRFNNETLQVKYNDKNIYDILEMPISEATTFFENQPKIYKTLSILCEVGLGYLKLGQPSPTLSGGEAQRIKLVRELRRTDTGKTLYILDEPTTGLHFFDIQNLLSAIQKLVEKGNSVVVIEHNLDIIKVADYIIDLGPEGGEGGGEIVVAGTPEKVMRCKKSYTGQALKGFLHPQPQRQKPRSKVKPRDIKIFGAMKNNLKNIDVCFPKDQMTVVTGVSGSGKTSLVFDTLFAEGQRAFLESLSTYARRFLGRLDHGFVDSIEGLAPAIAIDQKNASRNPRSTVATMTEIYDYLRILYSRVGVAHCPECNQKLQSYTSSTSAAHIVKNWQGHKGMILAPLYMPSANKYYRLSSPSHLKDYKKSLIEKGFSRILIGGTVYRLDEKFPTDKRVPIHLIIDRIHVKKNAQNRIAEAMETAFHLGENIAFFYSEDTSLQPYSTIPACIPCDYYQFDELHPRYFSFNHYLGGCADCDGLGYYDDVSEVCIECNGKRLNARSLAVYVGEKSIYDFCELKISDAQKFIRNVKLTKTQAIIAKDVLKEIQNRLKFLVDVGLEYLTLSRRANTLSGGEAQRIRLASQIGNSLVGVLYILDEPTIGLHPRDTTRLLTTLKKLVSIGNTVVMVEHDKQCMQNAHHIIDMGPGAGHLGGEVVATGTMKKLMKDEKSLTGKYLQQNIAIAPKKRKAAKSHLSIKKASQHNLQNIDVDIPVERLSVVTGVSGSGKSTLVVDVIQRALEYGWKDNTIKGKKSDGFGQISGLNNIDAFTVIDQSPIGRSPKSNPATYSGIFNHIRKFYAQLPGAKTRGFTASRFSFNRPGGRCEACEGKGSIVVHMHFLSDVSITCEACKGQRYLEETLSVLYKGKNISQVLDMDIKEALDFFESHRVIAKKLQVLYDVGLGYMKLGQPVTTLSGGEAQRMKLAAELSSRGKTRTLYLLDEPTTGLHFADVEKLISVLQNLVDAGNTVVVIEHNLDVIATADWIIDLGPEGGEQGGNIVFCGKPQNLAKQKNSHTGLCLKQHLQNL
ncbi:excinuclease ABC subunit UvrA [Candidatus Uabimicrobium amorphum]|uniref:UvrABC system protein A n=1 Tax=Uabimicrobium amorphum TaxID=2596890 RepID=A0A5S9IJP0_UABAM|nr:excinuclease ABC subunit UvrA [Candidatus Uabimicrobium amorphum]BBM82944.1 UvrABC system protein A [Candidatus Uabimicrobium amorphum]